MSTLSIQWQKIAEQDTIRRSSQVITVLDDKSIGIFSGELEPREPVDSCIYQIPSVGISKTDNVKKLTLKDAPSPRVGATSATLQGKTYIFSGRGGVKMTCIEEKGALWCLDHGSMAWSLIKPSSTEEGTYPEARSYHTMTSDGASTIYVHAGCPFSGRLKDLWSFDITTNKWTRLPDAPGAPRGGPSITYSSKINLLYRMNGFDGKAEVGGVLDEYDPSSKTWTSEPFTAGLDGPEARSVGSLIAVTVKDKPYLITLFGEHDPSDLGHAGAGKMLSDVWAYDLEAKKWSVVGAGEATADKPCGRGWFAALAMGENRIVVQGGLAEDNSRLGDVWVGEVQAAA